MKKRALLVAASMVAISFALLALSPMVAVGQAQDPSQIDQNIPQMLQSRLMNRLPANEDFKTLLAAVQAAGLAQDLSTNCLTLFAPTSAAFAKLDQQALKNILANPQELKQVLLNHVVKGKICSSMLTDGMTLTTLAGEQLKVTKNANGVFIDGAKVTMADNEASNGVIHVIDTVLLPSGMAQTMKSPGTPAQQPTASARTC